MALVGRIGRRHRPNDDGPEPGSRVLHSLTFYTGELPADGAVLEAGHEPNGYFWEGAAAFLMPDIVARLDLDSEAGMFAAYGTAADLAELKAALEPVLANPQLATDLIARASATNRRTGAPEVSTEPA